MPAKLNGETETKQEAEHAVELAREQHVTHHLRRAIDGRAPKVRAVRLYEERIGEAWHVHDEDAKQRKAAHDIQRENALSG